MKTPDPKEELLQQLAVSLLRDVFAAAALTRMSRDFGGDGLSDRAFEQAESMLRRSHTPALIDKMKNL